MPAPACQNTLGPTMAPPCWGCLPGSWGVGWVLSLPDNGTQGGQVWLELEPTVCATAEDVPLPASQEGLGVAAAKGSGWGRASPSWLPVSAPAALALVLQSGASPAWGPLVQTPWVCGVDLPPSG